jgi:hypothetical protein
LRLSRRLGKADRFADAIALIGQVLSGEELAWRRNLLVLADLEQKIVRAVRHGHGETIVKSAQCVKISITFRLWH